MNFTAGDSRGNGKRTAGNAVFAATRGTQSKFFFFLLLVYVSYVTCIVGVLHLFFFCKFIFRLPRPHEYGGTYYQGVIVRKYNMGSVINIRVELTASHSGYFQFSICPDFKNTSQDCLDQHVLKMARRPDATKYYPTEGNKVYEMKYRLPKMPCQHCVLQWRYISGEYHVKKKTKDLLLFLFLFCRKQLGKLP